MSASNKKFYYTVARVMHWIAGIFIAFNLLSGWRLDNFPLETKIKLLMLHSGVGVTIFLLMLFRWWWRKSHNLYSPPKWWKRPSMLLQWIFYPLVLIQVVIGVANAAFIDYEVLAFGFIPFSSLAEDNQSLQALFLQFHDLMAWTLIALIVIHGIERWRLIFLEDDAADEIPPQRPANS